MSQVMLRRLVMVQDVQGLTLHVASGSLLAPILPQPILLPPPH